MDKVVIVGAGVAGINAATKLIDNEYQGEILIIDMGKDPHNRLPEEVMTGMLGAGGWSDGKLTYHTQVGGQLSKYCGDEKAMDLMDQVINNFKRFHPKPEQVQCSDPQAEPAPPGYQRIAFLHPCAWRNAGADYRWGRLRSRGY